MDDPTKEFISVIATEESWGLILGHIREHDRFSCPDKYIPDLIDKSGYPILIDTPLFTMHVYPPHK